MPQDTEGHIYCSPAGDPPQCNEFAGAQQFPNAFVAPKDSRPRAFQVGMCPPRLSSALSAETNPIKLVQTARVEQTETLPWLSGSHQDRGPNTNLSLERVGTQQLAEPLSTAQEMLGLPTKDGNQFLALLFPCACSQLGWQRGQHLSQGCSGGRSGLHPCGYFGEPCMGQEGGCLRGSREGLSAAQLSLAELGSAQLSLAQLSSARHCSGWLSAAGHSSAQLGSGRLGSAHFSSAQLGSAQCSSCSSEGGELRSARKIRVRCDPGDSQGRSAAAAGAAGDSPRLPARGAQPGPGV